VVEKPPEKAAAVGPVPGVTNAGSPSLERFAIRMREGTVNLSAWRLCVVCDEGEGAIVRVDAPAEGHFYRGEGVFLGWSQDRLASAYDVLRPAPDESGFELQQMG
jgi:hypothetical protein